MTKLRIHNFSISLDGYGAGSNQSRDNPLGIGGDELHDWAIATRTWRRRHGEKGGCAGIDDKFMARGIVNIGAWIMGRNMFGPIRGSWPDESWKGWWGTDPPFHTPVFVLTHYSRASIKMEDGTTFHFVTEGIHAALKQASEAAGSQDVAIGGGVSSPFSSISKLGSSMNCSLPLLRSCLVRVNTFLPDSTASARLSLY